MSYHFVFGASGAGKSTYLHKEMIRRAQEALRARFRPGMERNGAEAGNFIFIVPEQFTLETQKALVKAHPAGGILNVDVLSFGRLTHRIFEEAGAEKRAVIGDIGKSLILRRLAGKLGDELPVLGASLGREGYIAEVKSAVSEFMQYRISPDGLDALIAYAKEHGALEARLRDLQTIYRRFLEYERERFITSEETLDLVAEAIPSSRLAADSVFIFDGFTGFTPVQYRVMLQLMQYAPEVWISLTFSPDGGPLPAQAVQSGTAGSGQELFYLTRKTVRDLGALAGERGLMHGEDVFLGSAGEAADGAEPSLPVRFAGNPALAHLERSLFRYPARAFQGDAELVAPAFRLFEASTPENEAQQMCIAMKRLIAERGLCYRDFAVVCGDLAAYEAPVRRQALLYGIPCYFDTTREIRHNPLIETVRGALRVRAESWSYEAVFHYLRGGLTGLTADETDLLENYCLKHGVRSRKRWESRFENPVCEELRQRVLLELLPLEGKARTAGERTEQLEEFLASRESGPRMEELSERFAAAGDPVRAAEYRQIFPAVEDLLSQIRELLGGEILSAKDYMALLETGFEEIRLGTLPQQTDTVLVGDLERTRLTETKVLFVLGANDGNIPKGTSKGGLISDLDREFLQGSGVELSPTPRQQMYIQRLYLYLNLTKPQELLCVSCCAVSQDGKSIRPSYLMTALQKLFPMAAPGGKIPFPESAPAAERLTGFRDSRVFLSAELRRFAEGAYSGPGESWERAQLYTIYGLCASRGAGEVQRLRDAAFRRYRPKPLSRSAAGRLYGSELMGSVSRLERCADCYGRHFLQYGLRLREREEYVFRPTDSGTVLHDCLDRFAAALAERRLSWRDFSAQDASALLDGILREEAERYDGQILLSSARNRYLLMRMQRVLERTVMSLQRQLRGGRFEPAAFELSFGEGRSGSARGMELPLDGENGESGERLILRGRIDRLDICLDRETSYVGIIDYKSGSRELNPAKIREGRQLQLLVYMLAALAWEKERHPARRVIPAAMLYYRMQDPLIGISRREDAETAEHLRNRALRPTGMLNADPGVLDRLETNREAGASELLPVSYLKNGAARTSSRLFDEAGFENLAEAARAVMREMGRNILDGDIELKPYRNGTENACTWCPYRDACGFDPRTPGYETKH
ncbi:PD-(D/E)XK nuclease family protein [Lachnoclostridium sp. Marseille-P6806]|uniref:PD-(D/E)XK nuclease family protein n=1 Tax=Lachnoclostridium sp. Marseille-P6806 TaxID=2364793 RepID=UPI00103136C5|nr:PD-(D/E)XK nuclease family protein [Lachnoclostridium sp. Marseille-P6806]